MSSSAQSSPAALQRLIANAVAAHDGIAAHLGLNPTDLRCLGLVATEPGMTPTRLAELAGLTTGAITGVLDRLEESGFVRREADAADRRRLTVRVDEARIAEWSRHYQALAERIARVRPASNLEQLAVLMGEEADRLRVETRGGMIGDTYLTPLVDVGRARLAFATGAPRLSLGGSALGQQVRMVAETAATRLALRAGDAAEELLRARFDGPPPDVRSSGGTVSMRYRGRLLDTRSRRADVALARGVPWDVEVSGGITDLDGDLRDIVLSGFEIGGGANHVRLQLGQPSGTSRIVLGGGTSDARFSRPDGVGVDLRVRGGVSRLRLDGRRFDGVAGEVRMQSDGYASATDRYEIDLRGGASDLRITTG